MARFTIIETVETTYEVNIDDAGYDTITAWRDGKMTDDNFHDFLSGGSPVDLAVTDRDIEEH